MGFTINYGDMEPEAAADKAVKDVKQWLGSRKFNKVVKILQGKDGILPRSWAYMALEFSGVRGFPASVMVDRYWNPQLPLDL